MTTVQKSASEKVFEVTNTLFYKLMLLVSMLMMTNTASVSHLTWSLKSISISFQKIYVEQVTI